MKQMQLPECITAIRLLVALSCVSGHAGFLECQFQE